MPLKLFPELKKASAIKKEKSIYFQMGENSAWRGGSIDSMPKFRRAIRVNAWLQGYSKGKTAQQQHREHASIDKAGLKKMVDVIRNALCL